MNIVIKPNKYYRDKQNEHLLSESEREATLES